MRDNQINSSSFNTNIKKILKFIKKKNSSFALIKKKVDSYQFKSDKLLISHSNFFLSSTFSEKEN